MKRTLKLKTCTLVALVGATLAGCGAPETDGSLQGRSTDKSAIADATQKEDVAERSIAVNGKADRELHLVARKVLAGNTEVAEFYEPVPGQILFSATGSPARGTASRSRTRRPRRSGRWWRRASRCRRRWPTRSRAA